jgi:thiol-disulfide isomerase/thioredoxin
MKGKVVLIDFWATWCRPCMLEVPTLKRAYEAFSDKGFEIIGVTLDRGDRGTFVKKLASLEIAWPQIYDGRGWESGLAQQFNVSSIPCTVLLDRDGTIAGVDFRGEALFERIAQLVEKR